MWSSRARRRLRRIVHRTVRPSFWHDLLTGGILKPAYFTLILRWCTWLIALLLVTTGVLLPANGTHAPLLLVVSGLWTALQTLYVPVLRSSLSPTWRRGRLVRLIDHAALPSLVDLVLGGALLLLSGGWGSPFYLFALSSTVLPALIFGYRAALVAGLAFAAIYIGSVVLNSDGWARVNQPGAIDGFVQYSIVAFPLGIFSAYLGHVLRQLEAERDRTRRALADERVLQAVTTSSLNHVAMPERFIGETISQVRRRSGLRAFAIVYRPPPTDGEATEARLQSQSFGQLDGVVASLERGEPRPAHDPWLCLPLQQGEHHYGTIVADPVDAAHRRPFVSALAGQLSTALANAHLYATAELLATQAERARLAREIHDGIAQTLFMLTLNLEACSELVERESVVKARLEMLISLARQALWQVRHYIHDLKPLLADEQTLDSVMANQVKEFQTITGLPVELVVDGDEPPLSPTVKQAYYRIAQEGLANVFKHASASQVIVRLSFTPEASQLIIEDNGRGFEPVSAGRPGRRGFGLENMRERAEELGGRLLLESRPGAGTRLSVAIPTTPPAMHARARTR